MEIEPHEPAAPVAGDPDTLAALLLNLAALLFNPGSLNAAIAAGVVYVEGKVSALRGLIRVAS